MQSYGGMKIVGNSTLENVAANGAYTTGWADHDVSENGDLSIQNDPASGYLELKPGIYKIEFNGQVTTAAATQLYLSQNTTKIAGALAEDGAAWTDDHVVIVGGLVRITKAMQDASENRIYLRSTVNTNVTVLDASLVAIRLDG